jgi:type VI protein secretion system component Hcp
MIAVLRSWLVPTSRRPRRNCFAARPVPEALETRAVLSDSITASIGGLMPPVVSVTLTQPTGSGVQEVSLNLKPSADDPQLFRDVVTGKILHNVKITLSDGAHGKDTIGLNDAVITSYRLIQNPFQAVPSIAITVEGQTGHTGSIAANIDGVMPPVVSLTIPQPTAYGAPGVSLVVQASKGVPQLFRDVATGKIIPKVAITLNQVGNGSTETISLTSVLISSIRFIGNGNIPTVELSLVGQRETIQ